MMEFLLTNGSPLDPRDKMNQTPLHYAASKGNIEAVKVLVSKRAVINKQDSEGDTPLHYAATMDGSRETEEKLYRYRTTCELLIKGGANPDTGNNMGWTPLHRAANNGRLEIIDLLLENGATLSKPDKEGNTALHVTCMGNRIECARKLLLAGARAGIVNLAGQTPAQLTRDAGLIHLLDNSDQVMRAKKGVRGLTKQDSDAAASVQKAYPTGEVSTPKGFGVPNNRRTLPVRKESWSLVD